MNVAFRIETGDLIYCANQMTSFYLYEIQHWAHMFEFNAKVKKQISETAIGTKSLAL